MTSSRPLLLACLVLPLLAACDQLGIESAATVAARKEAEGKALGAACRHAGRAIEDCYVLNPKADKASVFAGWREMNDYMRENEIAEVAPQLPHPRARRIVETAGASDDAAELPDKKRRME
ncbi:MAG TPA: hypothetical protein VNO84_12880 [Burkholderiaceae bacterium]|nr:hypothetical protein [Burkholderiaceae bacterium]